MFKRANLIFKNNPDSKKLTSIEKGRMQMEFIKMNEQPEDFMMLNRYLERAPQLIEEYTSSEGDMVDVEWSPLKYRKVDLGSKKDLQRSGILPKDGSGYLSPRSQMSLDKNAAARQGSPKSPRSGSVKK